MQAKTGAYWDRIKSSYWLVPSLMSVGVVIVYAITIPLDHHFKLSWLDEWLISKRPDAVRDMLKTVASSVITVGGVAFSVTIGAVAYSAMQFGPRLLTNFMKDRGNQVALGTFIATFLFSLLTLLSISGTEAEGTAFIPHLAVSFDLILVFFSLGVLIYFFHHVPESIHVFNLLAGIGGEFNRSVNALFPERIGEGVPDDVEHLSSAELPPNFETQAGLVRADADGYIQAVDEDALFEMACRQDLVLKVIHRPGDFVNCGRVVLLAWPADRVSDELADRLSGAYVIGPQRTPYQDLLFLAKELIEFTARALSTGQNDPYTAITCMNWLGSNLVALASRQPPDPRRFDEGGRLRVVAETLTFDRLADTIFDQLRPYVKNDPNAAVHMMDMIRWVAPQLRSARQREILLGHAKALADSCDDTLENDRNLAIIHDLFKEAIESLTRNREGFSEAEPTTISRAARQQG